MGIENLDRSSVGLIEIDGGSGWRNIGLIREEILKTNGKEITHLDVSGYPFGNDKKVYGTVAIEIEFIWEEIADIDLWHLVLYGGTMKVSTAGIQAIMNEDVIMKGASWIALRYAADFAFDSPVNVTGHEGSVTYVEGSDFYLDRKGGHLKRIANGLIEECQTVQVDYTYNTYEGRYFNIFEDLAPADYGMRLTKPMLNGDNLRITHSRVNFSCLTELPLRPGEKGVWAGVTSKIRFLKDSAGLYGSYGRWEIFTP